MPLGLIPGDYYLRPSFILVAERRKPPGEFPSDSRIVTGQLALFRYNSATSWRQPVFSGCRQAHQPPLTCNVCPVTYDESSLHKYRITDAISSGSPNRFSGICDSIC